MSWLRAFHIIAFVAWFGGLFYLPRLFVYHAMTSDAPGKERFKVMERKLFRAIMTPAAVATVVLGVALVAINWRAYQYAGWLYTKLAFVAVLIGYHVYCWYLLGAFARDANTHSHVFYRWFNEFPLILLVAIVLLAVLKPF